MDRLYFFGFFVLSPLVVLIAVRYAVRFPTRMAVALFFIGPFVGTLAMVVLGELQKSTPVPSRIPPAVLFFYLFYGLPFFGLWIAASGVIGWWGIQHVRIRNAVNPLRYLWGSVAIGCVSGPVVLLALWAFFSLEPDWPTERISQIISDKLAIFSLMMMGISAGGACGAIVGKFAGKEHDQSSRSEFTNA
jgi:hypothetical protein